MSALPARERPSPGRQAEAEWAQIEAAAPRVAAVMRGYLRQLGTFLAPRSVDAADSALRQDLAVSCFRRTFAAAGGLRAAARTPAMVVVPCQPRP